jgi:quercetin dioxygenase-like cupin family protein
LVVGTRISEHHNAVAELELRVRYAAVRLGVAQALAKPNARASHSAAAPTSSNESIGTTRGKSDGMRGTKIRLALAVQSWKLPQIATPDGSRSPVVLLSEDEARAVLVGLDAGQELGEHQVKEHTWVVVVDGSARIGAGGDEIDAPVGTLVHFEPDERHFVRSDGGAKILLLLAPWPGEGHYRGQGRRR